MSRTITQNPESHPEQFNEPGDFDSCIAGIRNQIADLQREVDRLEERQRGLKRQEEPSQAAVVLSTPAKGQFVQERWRVLMIVVASMALVYGGQFVLLKIVRGSPEQGLRQALAGGLLIAGALLFGAFAPRVSNFLPRLEFPAQGPRSIPSVWRNRWSLGWLCGAIVLAVIALIVFATLGESSTLVLLWLTSIGALIISQMQGRRILLPHIQPEERIYLVGLAGLLLIALILF